MLETGSIIGRRLAQVVADRLKVEVVVGLQGPRAVGKSTLLRAVAAHRGVRILDLDDPAARDAVHADPAHFVSGPSPVCIDEYQKAPVVLDAIKAQLNRGQRPGQFLITGSTRYEALPVAAQSLTGRLHLLTVQPLSQGEIAGVREDFVERCLADPSQVVTNAISSTARDDYVERLIAGGFPMALQRPSGPARHRWFDDYVTQVIERDLLDVSRVRQRAVLPRLLVRLAGQTGQVLNVANAAEAVGLERTLADSYTKLLEAVFLVQRLPAWGTTLRSRAAARPKVHLIDSGIAARLQRVSSARLAGRDPAALNELGHLLETFVVGEVRKQVSWMEEPPTLGHWRTHDGAEVDLVLERDDGAVVAFEIKAGSRVPGGDVRGLASLRDAVGARFLGGIVLYLGERSYTYDDRIHVVPVDRLWTPSG